MQFHADRRAALLWTLLAALNIVLAILRLHKHGTRDFQGLTSLVFWPCILLLWGYMASARWTFTERALVASHFGLQGRTVPYDQITSVDPSSLGRAREVAVILYGNQGPIASPRKLTVTPKDYAGFLAELERHVPATVMHV